MGQSKTNNFTLQYAIESATPGVLDGSPLWKEIEPNSINAFGDDVSKTARAPISRSRQRRKGKVSDKSASVELELDTTLDPFEEMAEVFMVANAQGTLAQTPTASSTSDFTVADNGITFAVGDLVHVRGMSQPANNGLFVVNGVPSSTSIPVDATLIAEASPPANAVIERAGIRAAAGDLTIDADGNLASTVLDFTTLPLVPGQTIYIGGDDAATQFFEQGNSQTNSGYARVTTVEANLLRLDRTSTPFVADDGTDTGAGGTGQTIDLYFGRFLRNVPVDDANYIERTVQFEGGYDNLMNNGDTGYEYSPGNYGNELSISLPETDKSTVTIGFVGIGTEDITATRKANAGASLAPVRTDSFGTSTDIARLRLLDSDELGLTTCFKSLTLTLANGVEEEKCLGTLGSPFINLGNLLVDAEATVLFTNPLIPKAIRDNTTLSLDFALDNDDGAIHFDLPAITLGGGGREFPVNRTITISLTGESFGDPVYDASLMISFFPYVPAS